MTKWRIPLIVMILVLTTAGAAFALNSEASTPLPPDPVGEPEPSGGQTPVGSDESIDPNEAETSPSTRDDAGICCKPLVEGQRDPSTGDGLGNDTAVAREPGPGIVVGEPHPLPVLKDCGPDTTVSVTSDGQHLCHVIGDDNDVPSQEPGSKAVEPKAPMTGIEGMVKDAGSTVQN